MTEAITILVMEDNPDDFFLLRETIESSEEIKAGIIHVDRLENAFRAAEKSKIHAAVIDLGLPDSFGLDTFLSFQKRFPSIPCIIMTGSKDRDLALTAVQNGAQDYLFKGEPSATAIIRTICYAIERHRLTEELRRALDEIKTLRGVIPICSICKNIRDDKGAWNQLEAYIHQHSEATFSHGICPQCLRKHYPEVVVSGSENK